jgi:pre-mRNA-splicing factor RBM22/SLT11
MGEWKGRAAVGYMPSAPGITDDGGGEGGVTVGSDFPLVCETCLGSNPYVRMVKMPFGDKLCKISNKPYQPFRWRAGQGGRMKETIIAPDVAQDKNVCQACLVDMTFGVPVGVRDALLAANPDAAALAGAMATATSIPNQGFFYSQRVQLVASGGGGGGGAGLEPSRQLLQLARSVAAKQADSSKTAWRNLPKVCSFWLLARCNRVKEKRCPFRPCCGAFQFPELAATEKEHNKVLIEALTQRGPAAVMMEPGDAAKAAMKALHEATKGNRDAGIKDRYNGKDDTAARYLKRAAEDKDLEPPADPNCATLWVGGVEAPHVNEGALRDAFYAYGELRSVRLQQASRCAFVEFTSRAAAEAAAKALYRRLTVNGMQLSLSWARSSAGAGGARGGGQAGAGSASAAAGAAPPPPGWTPGAAAPAGVAALYPQQAAGAAAAAAAPPAKKAKFKMARPGAAPMMGAPQGKPYYASADPSRMGSKTD